MKTLTISVAAYNVEKFINNTLNSLLDNRILSDIEVLVIDDGGKDSSLEIAKEFETKYPGVFYAVHKENGGYGSVINTAVKLANGKYFKQLDGDDGFITENLFDYINLLKSIDSDYICTPTYENFNHLNNYKINDFFPNVSEGEYEFESFDINHILSMHGSTFKTKILKNLDVNITEHCFYTDVELCYLPIPFIKTIYIYHKPIYKYELGIEGQSVSIEGIKKHYKDHEKVFWKLAKYAKEKTNSDNQRKAFNLRLKKEAFKQYIYYCLLDVKQSSIKDLNAFDKKLKKEYPDIHGLLFKNSKVIRVLSVFNGHPFVLAHIWACRNFKNQ